MARKREDVDALLKRTSYLDHWVSEAGLHARKRGWAIELVSATRTTLEETFGADWLEDRAKQEQRNPIAGDSRKHPLGLLIEAPSASSVAKALELGIYLRRCAGLPRLDEVIAHLRSPAQYSRGRLQLALAYRLLRCGLSGVKLEPEADNGRKADLEFEKDEQHVLIECYEPEAERHHELEFLAGHAARNWCEVARQASKRVIVHVHVHRPDLLDVAARKQVEIVCHDLIRSVRPRTRATASESCFGIEVIDTSGASVEDVEKLAWTIAGNVRPAWIVNAALVRAADVAELPRGEPVERTRLSWAVITATEPMDQSEAEERLVDAIERKVPQVRRQADGSLGIVAVRTGHARSAAKGEGQARSVVDRIGRKVLDGHPGLAGVFLVDDGVDANAVPFVGGAFIATEAGERLDDVFRLMRRDEERRDIFRALDSV
jgi:hypothetical protein